MFVTGGTSSNSLVERITVESAQALEQWFQRADESLPVLTETARWVVFGVGALLWLAGAKLIKPACILGGLMLGMIIGGLSLSFVDSAPVAVGFMVGLGLLGALGAWLIFRAWVAMAAAVVFALAAPAAVLIWQGVPAEKLAEDTEQATAQIEERYNDAVGQLNDQTKLQVQSLITQGDRESLMQADKLLEDQGAKVFEAAREMLFDNLDDIDQWWRSKDSAALRTIGLAMLIGAGVGLLFGFVFPNHAVAIQSAMVGAVLMVVPGRELLVSHLDTAAQWTPTDARRTLLAIGLITAMGIGLQWLLYLRADNKQT